MSCEAATQLSANQRKPAETSGNQPERNSAQRSKAIVTGIDSSRSYHYCSSYYYYYHHYYYISLRLFLNPIL